MKNVNSIQSILIILLLCIFSTPLALSKSFTADEIEDAIKRFRTYEYASDPAPTNTIENIIRFIQDKPQLRAVTELQMIALLESDATARAKQYICHQLWIIATDKSIPILEKMLLERDTAEMACYALRTHPSNTATQALREALSRVDDQMKIRILNILGDRQDTACVGQLIDLLESKNTNVAEAAAISLGTIGTEKGIKAIEKARATASGKRHAIFTRAWLRGAEYYTQNNRINDAIAIYERLFNESATLLVRRSALVSALNTGHFSAAKLLIAAIEQDDPMLRAAGVSNSHLLKDPDITRKLISAIEKADSNTQVLLLEALGRREDPLVKDAVATVVKSKDINVKIAAYNVLAHVGDASSVTLICNALNLNPIGREVETMLACLRRMSADGVDRAIMEALNKVETQAKSLLIRVISDRRYRPAVETLYSYTSEKNPAVAKAALRGLGTLDNHQRVPDLIDIVLKNSDTTIAEEAVRAIIAITRRDGYQESIGRLILERLKMIDSATDQCRLMPALAAAPGEDSLKWLQTASKNQNAQVQDCAVRMLADYPEKSAAPILLDIFKTTQNKTHRILALRGCSRLCKTTDISAERAVKLFGQAMQVAETIPEVKLILSTLAEIVHPEALQMALDAMERPAVKTEASLAVVALAEKLVETAPSAASAAAGKILGNPILSELHPRARKVIDATKKAALQK